MFRTRPTTWHADILLFLVTAVWGATFPLMKQATDLAAGGMPVYWFLATRFTLAAVLLGLCFLPRLRRLSRAGWLAGLQIGLFLFAGYAFQTVGLTHTSSGKAGFITGLSVVLVPVVSIVWLRRRPTASAWSGVLVATIGLALLSLNADLALEYGDLLVLCCTLAFALHITSVSRHTGQHDPVALAIVQVGVAAALSWGMHLATARTLAPGVTAIDWFGPAHALLALLICSILATAAAFLLQNVLQPYTTPTHTALVFAAEPVWALVFSLVLLGEHFSPRQYVGAALILAGMLLAELPVRRIRVTGMKRSARLPGESREYDYLGER